MSKEVIPQSEISADMLEKEEVLKRHIAGYGSLAVAYSGGLDSTYLADVAHEVLDSNAWMVIADSPSIPRAELAEAQALAKQRGWRMAVIVTKEFENEAFLRNEGQRCYVCKNELFARMKAFAEENGLAVLAYGETADDVADATRVGKLAADEQGVAAPLLEVGMKKADIRPLSQRRGLPTWDKAPFACLSSRFPKGIRLNPREMIKVEQAEETLKKLGFRQYRARHHGTICRIEIDPEDFDKILDPTVRSTVLEGVTAAGYRYVTLDLAGYRMGNTAR